MFAIVSDRIVALFCKVKLSLKLHPRDAIFCSSSVSDDRSTMKIRDSERFTFDFTASASWYIAPSFVLRFVPRTFFLRLRS